MPELPEVETVCESLRRSVLGRRIAHVECMRPDLRIPFPDHFCETLMDKRIEAVERRSKYILATLEDGTVWITHLGMSGELLLKDELPETLGKHDHVVIEFGDGSGMVYNDSRRFGLMTLAQRDTLDSHPLLAHLGPEPLSNQFTTDYFQQILSGKTSPIKHVIMDASVVVGVGNIYACESLFRSGIAPTLPALHLPAGKVALLRDTIRTVLREAIQAGGSSLRDYVTPEGKPGYFQHDFQVYKREQQPCTLCTTPITRIRQQGRSTFYCPSCQRA